MAPPNKAEESNGKRKRVEEERESAGKIEEGSILFVEDLNPDTTDSDLRAAFGKFGELQYICSYPSRDFAFIHFKCKEDAKRAKDGLADTNIRSKAVKIEYAKTV